MILPSSSQDREDIESQLLDEYRWVIKPFEKVRPVPSQRVEVLTALEAAIAVDADGAGRLFDLSASTWRRMSAAGLVPAPVRIGPGKGSPRWVVSVLQRWAEAGCPTRSVFEKSLAMVRVDGRIGVLENRESF